MQKLNPIQKRENLNHVYRVGAPGPGGAYHDYDIYDVADLPALPGYGPHPEVALACIEFQKGPVKTLTPATASQTRISLRLSVTA